MAFVTQMKKSHGIVSMVSVVVTGRHKPTQLPGGDDTDPHFSTNGVSKNLQLCF